MRPPRTVPSIPVPCAQPIPSFPPETLARLRALAERWADAGAAERANYALYLVELCDALGVERPRPAAAGGRVAEGSAYQFEFPIRTTTRDGVVTTNFVDLYKAGCFALEAKDSADATAGSAATTRLLTKAFGQVSNYAKDLAERPPYVMVLDVGRTLIVWDRCSGTYGGFHLGHRIDLRTLADRPADVALLRDVWADPGRRDPRRFAQAITVEIAGLLGELAATLEGRGHEPERVARFLIRCVFTMFAEDVDLLPDASFKRLLDAVLPKGPEAFVRATESLWRAMDQGDLFGPHALLRFNGHFFADSEALPLERADLELLRRAADADWANVEPSIFGTLLVRALTPAMHADVPRAAGVSLMSNVGMAAQGFTLVGSGFLLGALEAARLKQISPENSTVVRPYRNGRDLTSRPRGVSVIDFALMEEREARGFPVLFDIVRTRVKPERDANKRAIRARYWWRFGEPNPNLRRMLSGLDRYIATVEVSKHRLFAFLDNEIAPDGSLILVGSDSAFLLGVLSSQLHGAWALSAGGRLGVGNDPRYNRTLCFSSFPFPDPASHLRTRIADVAERLDAHRKAALARDERVTMTGMYNVVERLRTGEPLTAKERTVHELAACGLLRTCTTSSTRWWPRPTAGRGACPARRSSTASSRCTTSA